MISRKFIFPISYWRTALMECVLQQNSRGLLGGRMIYYSAFTRFPTHYPAEATYARMGLNVLRV